MKKIRLNLPKLWAPNKDEVFVVDISSCGLRAAYLKRVGVRYELQDWVIIYHPDVLKAPDMEIVNFILTFAQKNSIQDIRYLERNAG